MNLPLRISRGLRRLLPRRYQKRGELPRRQYRRGYYYDKEGLSERWDDIARIVDLRPSDRVLDMGCAEGLISFEAAKHVRHVDGVEINPRLLERAISEAEAENVKNISFSVGSVIEFSVPPKSYDIVLFLGVMGKRVGAKRVGLVELEKMLMAARRQIIIRVNIEKRLSLEDEGGRRGDFTLHQILTVMDHQDFDAICFSRREGHGNVIVGNRRNSDARIRSALPLVVVPTEMMRDHPCLRDVQT